VREKGKIVWYHFEKDDHKLSFIWQKHWTKEAGRREETSTADRIGELFFGKSFWTWDLIYHVKPLQSNRKANIFLLNTTKRKEKSDNLCQTSQFIKLLKKKSLQWDKLLSIRSIPNTLNKKIVDHFQASLTQNTRNIEIKHQRLIKGLMHSILKESTLWQIKKRLFWNFKGSLMKPLKPSRFKDICKEFIALKYWWSQS